MKILLKSGTCLTDDIEHLAAWKKTMMADPPIPCTYSTDEDGLIIFPSDQIKEIRVFKDEVAASLEVPINAP